MSGWKHTNRVSESQTNTSKMIIWLYVYLHLFVYCKTHSHLVGSYPHHFLFMSCPSWLCLVYLLTQHAWAILVSSDLIETWKSLSQHGAGISSCMWRITYGRWEERKHNMWWMEKHSKGDEHRGQHSRLIFSLIYILWEMKENVKKMPNSVKKRSNPFIKMGTKS